MSAKDKLLNFVYQENHHLSAPIFIIPIILALIAKSLIYGVSPLQILFFWLVLLSHVIVPGILVYKLAYPKEKDWLMALGMGWALGLALQASFYLLMKATGTTFLLGFYPLVTLPLGAVLYYNKIDFHFKQSPSIGHLGGGSAIIALAIIISLYSMPESAFEGHDIIYDDIVFHTAMASELRHHWPLQDPRIAGLPHQYLHFYSHIFPATVSQLSAIPLSTLLLQITAGPSIALLVIQLFNAGRLLTNRPGAGLVACFIIMFHADVGWALTRYLQLDYSLLFRSGLGQAIYESMSTRYGCIYIATFAILIYSQLISAGRLRPIQGIAIGLIAFMSAGSKMSAIPPMLIGLAIIVVWQFVFRREKFAHNAMFLLIAGSIALVVTFLLFFHFFSQKEPSREGIASTAVFTWSIASLPLTSPFYQSLVDLLSTEGILSPSDIPIMLQIGLVILWIIGYLGLPGIGALMWTWMRWKQFTETDWWIIGTFASGLGMALMLYTSAAADQRSFMDSGLMLFAILTGDVISSWVANFSWKQLPGLLIVGLFSIPVFLYLFLRLEGGLYRDYSALRYEHSERPTTENGEDYLAAIEWIRTETSPDSVFVANHDNILVTAFGERRMFYEGYWGTDRFAAREYAVHRFFDSPSEDFALELVDEFGEVYILEDNVEFLPGGFSLNVQPLDSTLEIPPDYAELRFANNVARIHHLVPSNGFGE